MIQLRTMQVRKKTRREHRSLGGYILVQNAKALSGPSKTNKEEEKAEKCPLWYGNDKGGVSLQARIDHGQSFPLPDPSMSALRLEECKVRLRGLGAREIALRPGALSSTYLLNSHEGRYP